MTEEQIKQTTEKLFHFRTGGQLNDHNTIKRVVEDWTLCVRSIVEALDTSPSLDGVGERAWKLYWGRKNPPANASKEYWMGNVEFVVSEYLLVAKHK